MQPSVQQLSVQQRHELSAMDRMLSRDPTLRAVADLFAVPPPSANRKTRDRTPGRATTGRPGVQVLPRFRTMAAITLVAIAGLVCAAVTAPLHRPVLSWTGLALAVCAGVLFVVVAARSDRTTGAQAAMANRPPTPRT